MYEIVNKGLNNLNGVYSGAARHNIYLYIVDLYKLQDGFSLLPHAVHQTRSKIMKSLHKQFPVCTNKSQNNIRV
jgi:hypothetical protein